MSPTLLSQAIESVVMHRAQQGWGNRLCAIFWNSSAEALPTAQRVAESLSPQKVGAVSSVETFFSQVENCGCGIEQSVIPWKQVHKLGFGLAAYKRKLQNDNGLKTVKLISLLQNKSKCEQSLMGGWLYHQ